MPDDINDNYTLPPVYLASPGRRILAEQHNIPLADIAAAISRRATKDSKVSKSGDTSTGTQTVEINNEVDMLGFIARNSGVGGVFAIRAEAANGAHGLVEFGQRATGQGYVYVNGEQWDFHQDGATGFPGKLVAGNHTPTDGNDPTADFRQWRDGWILRARTHNNNNWSGLFSQNDGSVELSVSNFDGSRRGFLLQGGEIAGNLWGEWGGDWFATAAIFNKINWRINEVAVTATRFDGWYDYDMGIAGSSAWHFLPSGWVVTALQRGADGNPYRMGGRQPQVRINNVWYPLGGW